MAAKRPVLELEFLCRDSEREREKRSYYLNSPKYHYRSAIAPTRFHLGLFRKSSESTKNIPLVIVFSGMTQYSLSMED